MLEPIMKIEVIVQDEYLGAVVSDFNTRGGKINRMQIKKNLHIISGIVPLASMFGYATALRTLTQGRANHTMEFFDYEKMSEEKMHYILKTQLGIYSINLGGSNG